MIRPSSTPVEHTRKSYQGILKSAALLGSARVMTLVIGLARVKALAVLIGPVGVGLIGTYDVLVQMAIYVFGMGVQASGVRQVAIANSQQDPDRTARTIATLRCLSWSLGLFGTVVVGASAWAISRLTFKDPGHGRDILILSPSNLCKRVLEQRISARTGGYCQARQKLPTLVVTSVTDHLFEQLQAQMREELPDVPRPMFVIDGTTLRLPHERELVSAFPPGHNQHGDNHWPTMLLVAFHDVHSGLATRPSWGAMYGPGAVGEQELARQALERLPTEAIVLADGNFGIFAFAYAVRQTQRPLCSRRAGGKRPWGVRERAGADPDPKMSPSAVESCPRR